MTFRPKYITFDCYGTLTYFPMHQVAYDLYEGQQIGRASCRERV